MVQNLNRLPQAMAAGGFKSKSEFYRALSEGRFPRPDAYIGQRSPVWLDATLTQYQAQLIASAEVDKTFAENSALRRDAVLSRERKRRARASLTEAAA